MARIRLAISFDIPSGATREECLAYAVDAIQTMKGALRPAGAHGDDDEGDPMFNLDSGTVRGSFATTKGNRRHIVRLDGDE